MFCYEVGYDSYEEAPTTVLVHEKEYTQEQFDELVSDCTANVFKQKFKGKKQKYKFKEQFDHLLDDVISVLEKDFGFKRLVVQATFRPFGWASVKDDKDWEGHCSHDSQLKLIRQKINKK